MSRREAITGATPSRKARSPIGTGRSFRTRVPTQPRGAVAVAEPIASTSAARSSGSA